MTKIAIITGGSRGIGAATCRLAAAAGYDVCLNYTTDREAADRVVAKCQAPGVRAIAVQADIGDPQQVDALFTACDRALGRVTLLVNNAGTVGQTGPLVDLEDAALQATFALNVYGAICCAQQAIRRMAKSTGGDGGVIINVSSPAARLGSAGEYVHYAASKGAVDSLTIGHASLWCASEEANFATGAILDISGGL